MIHVEPNITPGKTLVQGEVTLTAQPSDQERLPIVWVMHLAVCSTAMFAGLLKELAALFVYACGRTSVCLDSLRGGKTMSLAPCTHVLRMAVPAIATAALVENAATGAAAFWAAARHGVLGIV